MLSSEQCRAGLRQAYLEILEELGGKLWKARPGPDGVHEIARLQGQKDGVERFISKLMELAYDDD